MVWGERPAGQTEPSDQVRIEVITRSAIAEQIVSYVSESLSPTHPITVCVETVEVNFHTQY